MRTNRVCPLYGKAGGGSQGNLPGNVNVDNEDAQHSFDLCQLDTSGLMPVADVSVKMVEGGGTKLIFAKNVLDKSVRDRSRATLFSSLSLLCSLGWIKRTNLSDPPRKILPRGNRRNSSHRNYRERHRSAGRTIPPMIVNRPRWCPTWIRTDHQHHRRLSMSRRCPSYHRSNRLPHPLRSIWPTRLNPVAPWKQRSRTRGVAGKARRRRPTLRIMLSNKVKAISAPRPRPPFVRNQHRRRCPVDRWARCFPFHPRLPRPRQRRQRREEII